MPELLQSSDLATTLGVSVRTIRRMFKNGTIPAPIRISRKTLRWKRDDILGWLHGVSSRN